MSLARNLLLALVSLAVFLGLSEGLLALAGVKPALVDEDPLVGFSSRVPLFVEANRRAFVHTAPNKRSIFNVQRFRRDKPEGTYRIFCLGGSTTYGRPYADRTSFCGWLRVLLPVADPTRSWELINAGGISYASYRVAALMEELVAYEPDLFVIYTGHNEFLEKRTYGALLETSPWVLEVRAILNQTRTYTALSRVVSKLAGRKSSELMKRDVLPAEVSAVLDDSVGLQAYHRDDALAEAVLAHYRINLNRMLDLADAAGAASLLVSPAANLRTCSPFKSESDANLATEERLAFADWLAKSERRRQRQRPRKALEAIDRALSIDPRHPEAHYIRAQILDRLERYDEARVAYQRAVDEDVCPIRALSLTLEIVSEVAVDREAPFVDWARIVVDRSEQRIPGDDYFLDHVHPTIEANRQLALLLIESLESAGVVEFGPGWNEAAIDRVRRTVEGSLDAQAHARALTNLAKVFGWAGKHREAHALSMRALETVGDAETYNNAAMNALRLGRIDEAIGFYHKVLERVPRHVPALSDLGFALSEQGRFEEALAYLDQAIALDPGSERAHYNRGHVLASLERYDEAVRELKRAHEVNPGRAEYLMVLGNVYAEMGESKRAVDAYDRALAMKPKLPKAHFRLAQVLMDSEPARSVHHFRAAIDLAPNSPVALTQLAWILASHPDAALRNGAQAVGFAESAAELTEQEDVAALDALGAAYAEVSRFEAAQTAARRAISIAAASATPDRAEPIRARLALYASGEPFRSD